jgi:hypothetical protein
MSVSMTVQARRARRLLALSAVLALMLSSVNLARADVIVTITVASDDESGSSTSDTLSAVPQAPAPPPINITLAETGNIEFAIRKFTGWRWVNPGFWFFEPGDMVARWNFFGSAYIMLLSDGDPEAPIVVADAVQRGMPSATPNFPQSGSPFNQPLAAVPEPSSLALAGSAAVGVVLFYSRRRRRKHFTTA